MHVYNFKMVSEITNYKGVAFSEQFKKKQLETK